MAVEIEGGLQIKLHCHHGRVQDVDIRSLRPLQAVKIFHGKAIEEVLQTLPLLYHVCGMAQANAAVAVCEQAMAMHTGEASRRAREMLVWMETAREHLWRIMIDWTDKLGEEKDKGAIVHLQKFLPQLKHALFSDGNGFYPGAPVKVNAKAAHCVITALKQLLEHAVFAMPVEQWLKYTDQLAFQHWLGTGETVAAKILKRVAKMDQGCSLGTGMDTGMDTTVGFLPALDECGLHQRLMQADADVFVAYPVWEGKPWETGVLCRQQHQSLVAALLSSNGKGVMARLVARLAELAAIPAKLEQLLRGILAEPQRAPAMVQRDSGVGLAQVEAARGRLVHRLEMEDGTVRRYQILAPTEWNFHPQGIAAQLLKRLPAQDESVLKQQAELVVNTIDPCVRYTMTVH